MQYGDCDAAIVQVALHGHHYQEASTIGSKLWLRNGRRVQGIQSFILLTVEFGTASIFLTSTAIAVYTSNSAFGTSSPIASDRRSISRVFNRARIYYNVQYGNKILYVKLSGRRRTQRV